MSGPEVRFAFCEVPMSWVLHHLCSVTLVARDFAIHFAVSSWAEKEDTLKKLCVLALAVRLLKQWTPKELDISQDFLLEKSLKPKPTRVIFLLERDL